ncbi:MAG: flavodoxin domain-containing protein [Kofleriaceae bacterium]
MTTTRPRHVLVTYGSKRGGTAETARSIAEVLRARGFAVDCLDAARVSSVDDYDAFVVGGALYMARWHRAARRFVSRFLPTLRAHPVWFFSSGPLDDTAKTCAIPPTKNVARQMERVRARGHATFGGRLLHDATGFVAASMAKKNAGDWRDWTRIETWAAQVGDQIGAAPRSTPTPASTPARWILATLLAFVGITAVLGGLALMVRTDGSLLRMPASYLEHALFEDFLVPGILLFAVIGLGHLIAGWLVMRRSLHADLAALLAGATLTTWIVAQMILLGTFNGLQIAMLVIATLTIAESVRRHSWVKPTSNATT